MSGDGGAGDDPEIVLPIRAVRRGDRHLFTAVLLRPQFAGGLDRAMPVGDRPKRCNAGCDVGVAAVGKLILCPTPPFGSPGRRLMLLAQMQPEIGRAECTERVCQYVYITVAALSLITVLSSSNHMIPPSTTKPSK